MKITNMAGLPEPIVHAIEQDPYDRGMCDISVTQLIGPPKIRALSGKHDSEITVDAADRMWALFGSSVHYLLERAYSGTSALVERRLYMDRLGKTIGGQFDVYEDGTLYDYKISSVYAHAGKREWEQQLNILRLLCEENNLPVKALRTVGIWRDWRPREAAQKPDYPQCQVTVIPVPLWTVMEAEQYVADRLSLHFCEDPAGIQCTDEDTWYTGDSWALMKTGLKRAKKVYGYDPSGNTVLGPGEYIEKRPGQWKRCERYCPVADFCAQYKANQVFQGEGDDE